MIGVDGKRSAIQVLVEFFTPKMIAKASLSNCEYHFSAGASVREANAIGCSDLSSIRWANTAPMPYCDASHDNINSLSLSKCTSRQRDLLHLSENHLLLRCP